MSQNVFAGYKKANKVVLVATDKAAHALFAGKTIGQIGQEFSVNPDSVEFTEKDFDGNVIINLAMVVNGTKYSFPMSVGLSALYEEGSLDVDTLLECEARVSTRKKDNADYMTIGKPGGTLAADRSVKAFASADVETVA